MKRIKIWTHKHTMIILRQGMPKEGVPRWFEYFRIGPHVGKCIFKSLWIVVMWVPKGWEYQP